MNYLKISVLILTLSIFSSCGDDEPDTVLCDYTPCTNVPSPEMNLIGEWNTFDDDDEANGDVEFRADGTAFAPQDSEFALFFSGFGNNGWIEDFTWSYDSVENRYLFDYGPLGLFQVVTEIDCDYMVLENISSITNDPDGIFAKLCRK